MTDLATERESAESTPDSVPARAHLLRQLLKRRTFIIGVTGLIIIVLVALGAPLLAPHDPLTQDLANSLAPPFWSERGSFNYPLGTDTLGRDVASRLMYGARNSLVIAFFAVLLASFLGLAAGLSAGFSRGWWDSVLMRLGDIQLAFPFILLAIVVLGVITDRNAVHLILVGTRRTAVDQGIIVASHPVALVEYPPPVGSGRSCRAENREHGYVGHPFHVVILRNGIHVAPAVIHGPTRHTRGIHRTFMVDGVVTGKVGIGYA